MPTILYDHFEALTFIPRFNPRRHIGWCNLPAVFKSIFFGLPVECHQISYSLATIFLRPPKNFKTPNPLKFDL